MTQRFLVIAEVVVGESDAVEEEVGQGIVRAQPQGLVQRVQCLGETADVDARPAERHVSERKIGVEIDRLLRLLDRGMRPPGSEIGEAHDIVAIGIVILDHNGACSLRRQLRAIPVNVVAEAEIAAGKQRAGQHHVRAAEFGVEGDRAALPLDRVVEMRGGVLRIVQQRAAHVAFIGVEIVAAA
ncbi:hypothetical protein D9M72_520240 [compost metagenome]